VENYGYSINNPFPEHMIQQGGPRSVMSSSDQGLSPPYSNQSPPYSVQSNMALSPHGYISMKNIEKT
jgi:Notch 1